MATSTDWTYASTLLSTAVGNANTMIVRRLIGDVLVGDRQLQDGEINFAIAEYSNLYLASAECSRWLASQYSRLVDTVQGDLKTNYSMKAMAYMKRATELEFRGMSRGAGAMPYVGGIDVTDKAAQVSDQSRVTPQFNIGMNDNILPIGVGSGNETLGNPSGGNGESESGPDGSNTP